MKFVPAHIGASILAAFCLLAACPAGALEFRISTRGNETFQGSTFDNQDFGVYETTRTPGAEIFGPTFQPNPSLFISNENMDAYTQLSGVHYFSLTNGATIDDGSLPFSVDNDDIIAWDLATGQASLFFDAGTGNVDALSFHSDGDLMLSFRTGVNFFGLALQDGDVVKFDPTDPAGTRIEFFDEDTFAPGWDLDG